MRSSLKIYGIIFTRYPIGKPARLCKQVRTKGMIATCLCIEVIRWKRVETDLEGGWNSVGKGLEGLQPFQPLSNTDAILFQIRFSPAPSLFQCRVNHYSDPFGLRFKSVFLMKDIPPKL